MRRNFEKALKDYDKISRLDFTIGECCEVYKISGGDKFELISNALRMGYVYGYRAGKKAGKAKG